MSLTNLRNRSIEVRNETNYKANTASRIGQILIDVVDYLIALVADSHTHTNKTVLDDLSDTGSKLTYKGQVIETTSEISVSTWIDPPVIKKVATLPLTPTDGDRYILTTDNRIYEYDTSAWVVDSSTDPNPVEGSAVVVRYNTADELINAIHLFELGDWVDKSVDFSFDTSRFLTTWDETNGRRLIPIVGSPDDITETGRYYGSDNVVGSPLYDAGDRSTAVIYYFVDNHNSDSAYQLAISTGMEFQKWERRKISGTWNDWMMIKPNKGTVIITTSSSVTPTGDAPENEVFATALTQTLTITNPSGTPINGNTLLVRIYSAAAQTLTFGTDFRAFFEALPPTTIAGKEAYFCFVYNDRVLKWDYVSKGKEF